MRKTLRAMSALLGYPSAELQAHIPEIRAALVEEGVLPREARLRLEPLLDSLERDDLLDAQASYSDLFDRSRMLSLHLFEHVHGESRERGQAMIDLGQLYIDRGFAITANELPDYLPLFLEFVSCLPPVEAQEMLGEPAHVLSALEERLIDRESPYAAVFGALVAAVAAEPDLDALEALRASSADSRTLDEEWEDAPVEFGRPSFEAKQATGVVARIRAAQRAVAGAFKG